MTCDDLQSLLHGYVDGELDLVRHLDIEQHLAGCPECARACQRLHVLRSALRDSGSSFAPPPDLRRRLETALRDLDGSRPLRRRPWGWLALAAAAMVLFALGFLLRAWPASEDNRLAREVVANHVRSLMLDEHLFDVKSSDRHTVKPWFHGKVDFAPAVHDFAEEGFPLAGGRLDYLDNHAAAALIYHRRKHVINLFLWPSPPAANEGPHALTRQGYNLLHWSRGGLTYWAVSDLNAAELRTFADLVLRQTPPVMP
ncbi:MAG TPA: anti-sigma factor [Gemmataceae bacterium]